MVDAVPQLVQCIKLFAGAEVGVKLHHRIGAIQVAREARDECLAGHLGKIVVDGGPGAQAGGRGVPGIPDLGPGDIDAETRQLEPCLLYTSDAADEL